MLRKCIYTMRTSYCWFVASEYLCSEVFKLYEHLRPSSLNSCNKLIYNPVRFGAHTIALQYSAASERLQCLQLLHTCNRTCTTVVGLPADVSMPVLIKQIQ
jgi:predicted aldo/keto reductase-like oxidoreductase